jgi:hypothetical protein
MKLYNNIHRDLVASKKLVYSPCGFNCSEPQMEVESTEYGACFFELNGLAIRFRVAKTTPTKLGQFVTLWKRIGNGPIQPYELADRVDFFVITTRQADCFGQFIFPSSVLCDQGIIATYGQSGKRAIRVYPPWVKTVSPQAQKTQHWQLKYFLEIPENRATDCMVARKLYHQKH